MMSHELSRSLARRWKRREDCRPGGNDRRRRPTLEVMEQRALLSTLPTTPVVRSGPVALGSPTPDLSFTTGTDLSSGRVQLGDTFHYNLTITPTAGANFTNVSFPITFPTGFDYTGPVLVGGVERGPTYNSVIVSLPSLPASGQSFSFQVTVDGGSAHLGDTGTFTADVSSTPSAPTHIATFPSVTVGTPTAALSFTGHTSTSQVKPGDNFSYSFDESNAGPAVDNNLRVAIQLPAGVSYNGPTGSVGDGNWSYDTSSNSVLYLQNSFLQTVTPTHITIPVHVAAGINPALPLIARATYTSDLNPTPHSFTFPTVTLGTITPPPPTTSGTHLTVGFAGPASAVGIGSLVRFTITIRNDSNTPATGLVLSDTLAGSRDFKINAAQSGTINGRLPDLAPHATKTITIVATAQNYGNFINSVSVSAVDSATHANVTFAAAPLTTVVARTPTLKMNVKLMADQKSEDPEVYFSVLQYYAFYLTNDSKVPANYNARTQSGGLIFTSNIPDYFNVQWMRVNGKDVPVNQANNLQTQLGMLLPGSGLRVVIAVKSNIGLFSHAVSTGSTDVAPWFQVSYSPPAGDTTSAATVASTTLSKPLHGFGPGPDAFVNTLFQGILHRNPTPVETLYWSGALVNLDVQNPQLAHIDASNFRKSYDNNEGILAQTFWDLYANERQRLVAVGKPPGDLAAVTKKAHDARYQADYNNIGEVSLHHAFF